MRTLILPIEVRLTLEEIEECRRRAKGRNTRAELAGAKHKSTFEEGGLSFHSQGMFGECAFHKISGLPWPDTGWERDAPDFPPDIEVRCTVPGRNLLVYDKPERRFVLVLGSPPDFTVRGWCYGHEAMKPCYLRQLKNKVYLMPPSKLWLDLELEDVPEPVNG